MHHGSCELVLAVDVSRLADERRQQSPVCLRRGSDLRQVQSFERIFMAVQEQRRSQSEAFPSFINLTTFRIPVFPFLEKKDKSSPKKREEPSSYFQRQRVDDLLANLANKFPPKVVAPPATSVPADTNSSKAGEIHGARQSC